MGLERVAALVDEKLKPLSEKIFQRNEKRISVDVPPAKVLDAHRVLFEQMEARLATTSGVDLRDRIEVLYHYCMDADNVIVTLRTWAEKPERELEAASQLFPGARFVEREIHDLLGVKFLHHPDFRRLLLADDWPEGVYPYERGYPARHPGPDWPASRAAGAWGQQDPKQPPKDRETHKGI